MLSAVLLGAPLLVAAVALLLGRSLGSLPGLPALGDDAAPWVASGVVLCTFGLFALTSLAADLVAAFGLTALLVLGVLTPQEAFAGFANEGVATIAVLYVVVAGLRETGIVGWMGQRLFGRPRGVAGAQLRVMVPIAALSAFLNNTPLVAMMLPALSDWARRRGFPASKVMIPLSYAAVLGGSCTLIGTSTNLVVSGLLIDDAGLRLGLFDVARVGVPCALLGIAYVLLTSRWTLPDRQPVIGPETDPRTYTVEMMVSPHGPLAGKTILDAGLRHLPGLYLASIEREGKTLTAVAPDQILHAGDRLGFVGVVESVVDLRRVHGLLPAPDQLEALRTPSERRLLVEAVLSEHCPIVGATVRGGRFRTVYGAVVIAVARGGERLRGKIGDMVLRPGDTLLLEAPASFAARYRDSRDFFLVSPVPDSHPLRFDRAWLAGAIFAGMVATVTLGWLSMLQAALLAAGAMLASRCVGGAVARRAVDWSVLVVIAASFALGRALEVTGVAETVAERLLGLAGHQAWWSLLAIYLVTALFTELISNNGAAVLMFPIATATAAALDASVLPFAVAIMMAASFGFASPIGYQTHLMVYGPGGYRFGDFIRIGLPLDLLMALLVSWLAPRFWPF